MITVYFSLSVCLFSSSLSLSLSLSLGLSLPPSLSVSLCLQEKVASESLPLLGFTVKLPDRPGGEETTNVFELYHKKTLYYTFKAEDNHTAKR